MNLVDKKGEADASAEKFIWYDLVLVRDESQVFASCDCTDRPRWQEMPSGTRT